MNCPACAHANRDAAKFCEECGTPLKRNCTSCGVELRPTAKFCDECGTAVAGAVPASSLHTPQPTPPEPPTASDDVAPPTDGARKIVTIVFADLVGSTALHERLDPESARRFMERYYAAARHAVESHGGKVTQLLGDGVKAVFGIPVVAEDDALRAVKAAVAMQEAFQALAEQQRAAIGATGLRVAVNTGEVVAKDETEIIGDPVNVAARLQEQGKDGDVVVGQSTQQLIEAQITLELLGSFALKGRAEEVKAYRVVSLDAPAGAAAAAFVGRDEELDRLQRVFDRAVAKPATSLAVLVGSPGLGKSRLIDEFGRRSRETATVVMAHCDAGGGGTFAPLAAAIREHFGLDADAATEAVRAAVEAALPGDGAERTRIASGIAGLVTGSPAAPEETFFVIRRLFAALAGTKPVVLVIDDLQWAEPLLLDLVEHLVEWGSDVPLLVLVGARPELRELRGSLVMQGGLVSDVVMLGGLDAGAATRLAANVVGAVDLPAAVAAKVLATSEGNPLFIGELVRMLVHEGALTRDGDRWIIGTALATLEMPPTIHALLAARIERLPPEERAVLERAAVVGRQFSRSAVAELLPRNGADLDARLQSLQRSELIERDTGWLLGEPVLRFHHVLIRDAAYRRILKGTRAELHGRLADWMEDRVGDATEHDETIGRHLEQAHELLGELGPLDATGRTLGERASKRLAAAGRAALAGDDVPLAANLLGRALARLPQDDATRADLALDWCEALLAAGDVGPAAEAIDELGRFIEHDDRLRAWHTCFAGQHTVMTAPEALDETADAVAAAAKSLAAQDDAAGEAKAHFVYALALSRLGKVGACEAALDQALAAARRAGDRRRANTVLAIAPLAALWGPSPVTRASGRCLDVVRVLRITQGAPAVEAVALSCQGVLEALRGRTDAARRMIASARKMVEELGITQRLLETDVFAGLVALHEGEATSAERSLRTAYDGLRELGLSINAAQAAALLARALLAQDRAADAETLSHEAEALAGDDLKAAIAWRGVRAEALAQRGEHAAAVELAQKAVEIAAATDALLDHADARLALAAALRAAGRTSEAAAEERRASELWDTKGATLLGEQAARTRTHAAPTPSTPIPQPTTPPRQRTARRRIHPNRATAWCERYKAALATRDLDTARAMLSDDYQCIDHPNGASYGPDESMEGVRNLYEADNPSYRIEVLATVGPSLALTRSFLQASGARKEHYDVGTFEAEPLELIEVDESGLLRYQELFASDRLGDAVARLYTRYADGLSAGPERERATETARAVAAWLGPIDLEVLAATLAPTTPLVDHRVLATWTSRNAAQIVEHFRVQLDLASDFAVRIDDVIALEPDARLVRCTYHGTNRTGGGTFENRICQLSVHGPDGGVIRLEAFEAEDEARALARFDELRTDPLPARPAAQTPAVRRRVAPNATTATGAKIRACVEERRFDALRALYRDDFVEIDHPTGATYGPDESVASTKAFFASREPRLSRETLATLGPCLALERRRFSAAGTTRGAYDVGAHTNEAVQVIEVDQAGLVQLIEVFAVERLGDAVARMYARYAEPQPDGPAKTRAATTARSIADVLTRTGVVPMEEIVAPDFQAIDHTTVGPFATQGAELAKRAQNVWEELTDDRTVRVDEVFALTPDVFLRRSTVLGEVRSSGGTFESSFLLLSVFGPDGRLARLEQFNLDDEAAALTRVDEITARAIAAEPRRRVSTNRATAVCDRLCTAIDARDVAATDATFADDLVFVHHSTAVTFGKREAMTTWKGGFRAERLEHSLEYLASLGDALALTRQRVTIEGFAKNSKQDYSDFGVAEMDHLVLVQESEGQFARLEQFALDRLGEALARLYELYAESLPDGPERRQATASARAIEAGMGVANAFNEEFERLYSPTLQAVDHRTAGVGRVHGAKAWLEATSALLELTKDVSLRTSDVLAVCPSGCLIKVVTSGVLRDGGGPFEREFWCLTVWGDDGLATHLEQFNADAGAEALARFDALTGTAAPQPAYPFANEAWRQLDAWYTRLEAEDTHDWSRERDIFAPEFRFEDRRRLNRLEAGAEEYLRGMQLLLAQPGAHFARRLVATRGERLALSNVRFQAEADGGGGPLVLGDTLALLEGDAEGRAAAAILFDLDDEETARAELDARWAAGEAPAHPLASTFVERYRQAFADREWSAMIALGAPGNVAHNHRLVGWGTLHGSEAWVGTLQELVRLAPDVRIRSDHLRLSARGLLWQYAWAGTRDGGAFETPVIVVTELDDEGRQTRFDVWDAEMADAAHARFAEITSAVHAPAPSEPFANAVTRLVQDRIVPAFQARDWTGFAALFDPGFQLSDQRPLLRVDTDRDGYVAMAREIGDLPVATYTSEVIATRGERLAIFRSLFQGESDDVGPSSIEILNVTESDAVGRALVWLTRFDADDLDAAYAELDRRYAAGEGGATFRHFAIGRDAFNARDWDTLRANGRPDAVMHDCRRLSLLGTTHGFEAVITSVRGFSDLAPDIVSTAQHIRQRGRVFLQQCLLRGTSTNDSVVEFHLVQVAQLDEHGRLAVSFWYDVEQLDEAWTRFEALSRDTGSSRPGDADQPRPPTVRRVRPNAATRNLERHWAAIAARDLDALRALMSEQAQSVYHPTGSTLLGPEAQVETWKRLFRTTDMQHHGTVLGTLGDSLTIGYGHVSHAGADIKGVAAAGPAEGGQYFVLEVDERGLTHWSEVFADDRLSDAIDCLYTRYASQLPAGPAQKRARAIARTLPDQRAYGGGGQARLATNVQIVDHRILGTWSARGADEAEAHLRGLHEVADGIVFRDDDVLALEPDAALLRRTSTGTDRLSGGVYERPLLVLMTFGDDGLITRYEFFDVGREADALARFDALVGAGDPAVVPLRFANAATRMTERTLRAWEARDANAFRALHTVDYHQSDRRGFARIELDREQMVARARPLLEMTTSAVLQEVIATRGERLALVRALWSGEGGDIGPSEIEWLVLHDVNEREQATACVLFNPTDVDAARAEMDARWRTIHEETPIASTAYLDFIAALNRRDWDAAAGTCAAGFRLADHRMLGWGDELRDMSTFLESQRVLAELAPDARYRLDHACAAGSVYITQSVQMGTRDGGAFENPIFSVAALDDAGKLHRLEIFDETQADRAWEQFRELTSEPTERFANAAVRTGRRFATLMTARDWDGFTALLAEDFEDIDRRRHVQLTYDREQLLAGFRETVEMTTEPPTPEVLATRGDHLALARVVWRGAGGDVGPTELEWLLVSEVNPHGELRVIVTFDPDDLDVAYAELDARWEAGADTTPAIAFGRAHTDALARRDWDTLAQLYAPNIVARDHRLVGWDTLEGRSAFLRTSQSMVELAPDVIMRPRHVRANDRAMLSDSAWLGTRDGGPFESAFISVAELNEQHELVRADFYDPKHVDDALARFAEIGAGAPSDPRAAIAKPNAATVAADGWAAIVHACAASGDWDPVRASCAPEMIFDDRRRLALVSGDRELLIASLRERTAVGGHLQIDLMGTAGDRVTIGRSTWAGGPEDGRFEIIYLFVLEVDDAGKITAILLIDDDEPLGALHAAWERWEAIDPTVAAPLAAARKTAQAFNSQDRAVWQATYTDDVVVVDHRHASFGRIEGSEAYADSIGVLWKLAPDSKADQGWFWPAIRPDGGITALRRTGTVEGGGPFESEYLHLFLLENDRIKHAELFELDALDTALARFEELHPGASPRANGDAEAAAPERRAGASPDPFAAIAKPNAATRVLDRWLAAFDAGVSTDDWGAFTRLCAPDMVFEDRQPRALVAGGAELMIASARERAAVGARPEFTVVGTAGDRVSIGRSLWAGGPADGRFEVEFLTVTEVDEHGLITAMLLMDIEDPSAALREAWRRWAARDPVAAPWVEIFSSDDTRDRNIDTYRLIYDDDLVVEDRRRTGAGRIEGLEAYHAAIEVYYDLAPDTRFVIGEYWAAYDQHAALLTFRRTGTVPDGGDFESTYLVLAVRAPDGRIIRQELFEPEALDAALARFEELRPAAGNGADPLAAIVRPNAASRWVQGIQAVLDTGDWEAVRARCAPEAVYEDRQRQALLAGDLELALASLRERMEAGTRIERIRLLGTLGDRIAISQLLWVTAADSSRSEVEFLVVQEVDEHGRLVASLNFDLDNRREAIREGRRRWAAIDPVAAPWVTLCTTFEEGVEAHDAAMLGRTLSESVVVEDRRRTGYGHSTGRDAATAAAAALWELAPDIRFELGQHWITCEPHGALFSMRRAGTVPGGGPFELEYLGLGVRGPDGLLSHVDLFELDQLDAALARLKELRPDPLAIPPNAAMRTWDRWHAAVQNGNLDAVRQVHDPSYVMEDRRRLFRTRHDREGEVLNAQWVIDGRWRVTRTLLATAGDHLALQRLLWTTGDVNAASEVEFLEVGEIDPQGRFVRVVAFDPDDRDAAHTELLERFVVRGADGMARGLYELIRSANARDLAGMRQCLCDDFVLDDHRRTGMGRLEGADAYLPAAAAIMELTRSSRADILCLIAAADHGVVGLMRASGTNLEGGAYESFYIAVCTARGEKAAVTEFFEPEERERALARFEELRPDPLRIPPNAATRNRDRACEYGAARNWTALRTLYAPNAHFEDRRPMFRTTGDERTASADLEYLFGEIGGRPERTLLATGGERLALEHWLWTSRNPDQQFELDALVVVEVDASDLVTAIVLFHPDDRAAASDELRTRWAAGGSERTRYLDTYIRFWNAHDLDALRAILPDDFSMHDHRRTGIGRAARDTYLEAAAALFALSSDVRLEVLYQVDAAQDCMMNVMRWCGTNAEGGEVESVYATVLIWRAGSFAGFENFELDDFDKARTRFDELRSTSSPSGTLGGNPAIPGPPSTAFRLIERLVAAWEAGQFDAFRTLAAPGFRYEDRGKRALVTGDVETWLGSIRFWPPGTRIENELIALIGDRIVLTRSRWLGPPDGEAFEVERIRLMEVDTEGRLCAHIAFDVDDHATASLEAYERFAAGEAAGIGWETGTVAAYRAWLAHDWATLRAQFTPDFVYEDRRRFGALPTMTGPELVDSLASLAEMAPDLRLEVRRIARWNRHGYVNVNCSVGTVPDGGPFEQPMIDVTITHRGRIARVENFDVEDIDRALARFDELCAERDD